MAKTRTYIVSFSPAEWQAWGGYIITFDISKPRHNHRIDADNLPKLAEEVRRLATEYGRTCSPYIRVPNGERKPAGFDAWRNTINIIDVPTAADAACCTRD